MQIISDKLFDVLMEYQSYCEGQGSVDTLQEIDEMCGEMRKLWDTVDGLWPIVQSISGPQFIMTIFGAEQLVMDCLKDGMSKKKYYKDIYKDVRAKVELFAELHGKSEVISKQLTIES